MIGQTISHYRIVEKLGEGGMGVVYKAEDTRLGRTVALKFLHDHALRSDDSRKRFEREAKAAAVLNHPNVCTIYEIDEIDNQLFIAMAWAPGESLATRIDRGPLPLKDALAIALQCASGLQAAHAQGIVHRDLKPSNIFLTSAGDAELHAVVMDFGVARLARRSSLTREGSTVGTVGYMSPEQTFGGKVDQRTDIWALGVALYEMLVARIPFEGEYEQAIAYALVNENHEPVTALRAGLPIEIDRILDKALAKAPEERYQSMADLMVDLRALTRSLDPATSRPTAIARTPLRSAAQERKPRLAVWLPLAAAVGAAAALLLMQGLSEPPADPLSGFQLNQITRDAGLTMSPALSPDGNLVAYASDRGTPGALNLWIQQVAGGGAVQLTTDPAADHSPDFSPDGSRIAFRSERAGGGIFLIPALGGEARLAAAGGRRPRFSPDGARLTFYTAPPSSIRGSHCFVSSADGTQQRALAQGFVVAAMPIWIESGRRIAFWGAREGQSEDVWIVPAGSPDEEPFQTGLAAALGRQGLRLTSLDAWDAESGSLLFSAVREDSVNLWSVRLSGEGTPEGPARRLTLGRDERDAAAPIRRKIAFMAGDRRINVWSLPLNPTGDAPAGAPAQITQSAAADFSSVVSHDGKLLIFRSSRSGFIDIWSKRLPGGELATLTANGAFESIPRLSPDGSRVAYSVVEQGRRAIYAIASTGKGATVKLCDSCGAPIAWTPSGDLIYQTFVDSVSTFLLLHSDGESEPMFSKTPLPLYSGSLSRDGRWLAFKGDLDDNRTRVFVTEVSDKLPLDPAQWAEISNGEHWDDLPRFSPDGRLVYFTSDRDGFRCVWARRFDPAKKQPEDESFAVAHFHSMDLSLSGLSLNEFELSVGPGELVFPLLKQSGNIWMLEPSPAAAR
ncbi:MAG: protein kinase [Acidobacteria bacterium]|nr:protein kinase [Acidobacteriota bacterium]